MKAFADTISNFLNEARPVFIVIITVCWIAVGIGCAWPEDRVKDIAKSSIKWVVIGSAIVFGAPGLAEAMAQSF